MKLRSVLVSLALITIASPAAAQITPKRNPKAVALAQKVVSVSGGTSALLAIKDFTATGNITYYWAGKTVTGTVTLRGRGKRQFRIDANLKDGVRSWAFDNGSVWEKLGKDPVKRFAFRHMHAPGTSVFPAAELASALNDSSVSFKDLGLVTVDGHQAHEISIENTYARRDDPSGNRAKMSQRDFFINPSTFLVMRTSDTVYVHGFMNKPVVHHLLFAKYAVFSGVLFPIALTETIYHQRTFSVQVDKVTFNASLTNSDFQP